MENIKRFVVSHGLELTFFVLVAIAVGGYLISEYRARHPQSQYVQTLIFRADDGSNAFIPIEDVVAQCPPGESEKQIQIQILSSVLTAPDLFAGTCGQLQAASIDTVLMEFKK